MNYRNATWKVLITPLISEKPEEHKKTAWKNATYSNISGNSVSIPAFQCGRKQLGPMEKGKDTFLTRRMLSTTNAAVAVIKFSPKERQILFALSQRELFMMFYFIAKFVIHFSKLTCFWIPFIDFYRDFYKDY